MRFKSRLHRLIIFALLCFSSALYANDLNQLYLGFQNGSVKIEKFEVDFFNKYSVLIVGGFLSDLMNAFPNTAEIPYMAENARALKNHFGIENVEIFLPDSRRSPRTNARALEKAVTNLKARGKPIILMGHSMGGLISMLYASSHMDQILSGEIAYVITFQSPFDNKLADHASVPARALRAGAKALKGTGLTDKADIFDALIGMETARINKALMENLKKLSPAEYQKISDISFFVGSYVSEMQSRLKPLAGIINPDFPRSFLEGTYGERNDMLVSEHGYYPRQARQGFGHVFKAIRELDHISPTIFSALISHESQEVVVQRINSVMQTIFHGLYLVEVDRENDLYERNLDLPMPAHMKAMSFARVCLQGMTALTTQSVQGILGLMPAFRF